MPIENKDSHQPPDKKDAQPKELVEAIEAVLRKTAPYASFSGVIWSFLLLYRGGTPETMNNFAVAMGLFLIAFALSGEDKGGNYRQSKK